MSVIKNAVIESASLTINDRTILDVWLTLDYGGSCQGFGGYCLYLPKSFAHHSICSPAGHFIYRCLEVAGVTDFNQLKGRSIRVRVSRDGFGGDIEAIGHIVKDDWFCPSSDFAALDKIKPQP